MMLVPRDVLSRDLLPPLHDADDLSVRVYRAGDSVVRVS